MGVFNIAGLVIASLSVLFFLAITQDDSPLRPFLEVETLSSDDAVLQGIEKRTLKIVQSPYTPFLATCQGFESVKDAISCCSDTSFPVMAGTDLVELKRDKSKIIWGLEEHSMLIGNYQFYFSSEQNRQAFEQRPQDFLPLFGGFPANYFYAESEPKLHSDIRSAFYSSGEENTKQSFLEGLDYQLLLFSSTLEEQSLGLQEENTRVLIKASSSWAQAHGLDGEKPLFNTQCIFASPQEVAAPHPGPASPLLLTLLQAAPPPPAAAAAAALQQPPAAAAAGGQRRGGAAAAATGARLMTQLSAARFFPAAAAAAAAAEEEEGGRGRAGAAGAQPFDLEKLKQAAGGGGGGFRGAMRLPAATAAWAPVAEDWATLLALTEVAKEVKEDQDSEFGPFLAMVKGRLEDHEDIPPIPEVIETVPPPLRLRGPASEDGGGGGGRGPAVPPLLAPEAADLQRPTPEERAMQDYKIQTEKLEWAQRQWKGPTGSSSLDIDLGVLSQAKQQQATAAGAAASASQDFFSSAASKSRSSKGSHSSLSSSSSSHSSSKDPPPSARESPAKWGAGGGGKEGGGKEGGGGGGAGAGKKAPLHQGALATLAAGGGAVPPPLHARDEEEGAAAAALAARLPAGKAESDYLLFQQRQAAAFLPWGDRPLLGGGEGGEGGGGAAGLLGPLSSARSSGGGGDAEGEGAAAAAAATAEGKEGRR